jgi:hypothetical protein
VNQKDSGHAARRRGQIEEQVYVEQVGCVANLVVSGLRRRETRCEDSGGASARGDGTEEKLQ